MLLTNFYIAHKYDFGQTNAQSLVMTDNNIIIKLRNIFKYAYKLNIKCTQRWGVYSVLPQQDEVKM